jgi:hypothetical protein
VKTILVTPDGTVFHGRIISGEHKNGKIRMLFEIDGKKKGGENNG